MSIASTEVHPSRRRFGWAAAVAVAWAWASVIGLMVSSAAGAATLPAGAGSGTGPGGGTNAAVAMERGIEFLLRAQNKNGSWGSAHRTKGLNIFAPVPGAHDAFRCATTALCVESLLRTRARHATAEHARALERGEAWLLENLPKLRRADTIAIYNVWGHAYGIQALVAMFRATTNDPVRVERIREVIRGQIDLLQRYESVDGGWGYYDFRVGSQKPASDSTSFTTATVLVAFKEAASIGVEAPPKLVQRAIASIQRQRKNDFSYLYGEYLQWQPMRGINRPAGSLGRSQACNYALRIWGDTRVTEAVFETWLQRFGDRVGWLDIGRKRPVPHEAWFQIAAYFFYYGHYYAALCTTQVDPAAAAKHRARLIELVLPLQERDGSWWDFPFYDYHQPYGTAFALLTLSHCLDPAPAPAPVSGRP